MALKARSALLKFDFLEYLWLYYYNTICILRRKAWEEAKMVESKGIQEKVIYRGKPSQYVNFNTYVVCGFIMVCALLSSLLWEMFVTGDAGHKAYFMLFWKIAFISSFAWGIWVWLRVWNHQYELTTERFRESVGVLSRVEEVVELYRVRDITLTQPFSLRVMGLSNVILDTSDRTNPMVVMYAVKDGKKIADLIRNHVEFVRQSRGIQQMERL